MRIASFNLQNLRLRGEGGEARLDGARDMNLPGDLREQPTPFDVTDRRLTALVLAQIDADIVALQEVFDTASLDFFHDRFLLETDTKPYPFRYCIDGNDGRGLDVALMSRLEPDFVESNVDVTPADLGMSDIPPNMAGKPVFRRDCLIAGFGDLTLFVCHFKAPYPDPKTAWIVRNMEAQAVRVLIERRFADPLDAQWMVIGDLNEPRIIGTPPDGSLAPLAENFGVDLLERVEVAGRWTYFESQSGAYSRPDAIIVSPVLAERFPDAAPFFVRTGISRRAAAHEGKRFAEVGEHRPHASDHAALGIDL